MEETKKARAIIFSLELYKELPYTDILKNEIAKRMQHDWNSCYIWFNDLMIFINEFKYSF